MEPTVPKLLLADDSVTIQRVIELTFSREAVQVVTVGDGDEAIARIPIERPDVVLADIAMPRRSGYEVAAFVKGHPELGHTPVVLLAGAFEAVDHARAERAGCDGVIVKPFEPAQVVARVRELIERGAGIVSPLAAPRGVISPPAVPALRVEPAMPAVGVRGDTRRDEDAFDSYLSGIDDALARIDTRPARPLDVTSPPAPRALAVTLCPSAPGEESLEDFFARLNDAVSGSPLPAQETAAPTRTGLTRGGGDDGVRGAAAALKGGAIELIPSLDSLASGGYPRPAPGDPGWDWSEVVAPDVEALVERIVDRLRPELEASLRRAIYDELGKVTTMSSNARRRLA